MTKLARLVDAAIFEFIQPVPGFILEECFPADYLAALVPVPDDAQVGWIETAGVWAAPVVIVPAPTKAELTAYAAQKRWAVETGGITVGSAQIDTSRESQAMIANAYAYIVASGSASVSYKAASGWVTLDAAAIKSAALAVGAHVQTCFALEQTLDAEITAGTITTTAQIDAAAWPA